MSIVFNVRLVNINPQTLERKDGYNLLVLSRDVPDDGVPKQCAVDFIKASLPNYYSLGKIHSLEMQLDSNIVPFSSAHVPYHVTAEFEIIFDEQSAAKGGIPQFLMPIEEPEVKGQMRFNWNN